MNTEPTNPRDARSPSGHAAPAEGTSRGPAGYEQGFDLWRVAHRALRGRYRLAIHIALSGAVIGGATGALAGRRLYSASGLVRIASVLPQVMRETDQNRPMAMFDGFIQAQREIMLSRESIHAAMSKDTWKDVARVRRIRSEEQFAASLKVETRPRSDHLRVTFRDRDPAVAAAAVKSLIAAYQESFIAEQRRIEDQRMAQLQSRRDGLNEELEKLADAMEPLAEGRTLAELEPLCAAAGERVKKLRSSLADVQCALAGGADPTIRPPAPVRSPVEAAEDEILRLSVVEQAHVENQIAQLRSQGLGRSHPMILRLTAAAEEYRERAERVSKSIAERRAVAITAPPPVSLDEREANLLKLTQNAQDELKRLTAQREQLAELEAQAATIRQSLSETDSRVDALATEASQGSRLTVISGGDLPMTALLDNRLKTSTFGTLAGVAIPLGFLIIRGNMRRRYRVCDDAAADLLDQAPFVAVLPDLHAGGALVGAASRCIHDLRLRLQPPSSSDPRTYLVTSASPDEGKSSVALSLALSFAAAGLRTLLVDCDLTSRRLSQEFGVGDAPGLLEATSGAEPQIWRTRGGLSFLGAGRCRPEDACKLVPAATARVLANVRDRFDVVLLDSDPILTGITASVVAPQSSGVLLTLGRGQEQRVVQGALRHLGMLGATVAGGIFNRAPASDFRAVLNEQSQLRERAAQTLPERLNRFGPLVAAVLSSLSITEEDDLDLLPMGWSVAGSDRPRRRVA